MFKIKKKQQDEPLPIAEAITEAPIAETAAEEPVAEAIAEEPIAEIPSLGELFELWLAGRDYDESAAAAVREALTALCCGESLSADASSGLFELLMRGADFDRAVAAAEEAGEIKGRNASIDELTAELQPADGLPHPCAGSAGVYAQTAPSIFQLAREA